MQFSRYYNIISEKRPKSLMIIAKVHALKAVKRPNLVGGVAFVWFVYYHCEY